MVRNTKRSTHPYQHVRSDGARGVAGYRGVAADALADPPIVTQSRALVVPDVADIPVTAGGEELALGAAGGVTVDNGDTQEEVATIIAPGADLSTPGEATLGKWTLVGAENETADLSVSATASGTGDALADRTVIATGNADATANTVVSAVDGDAEALTVVTVTGVQDGLATTTVDTVGGTADVSIAATATDAEFGNAYANTAATSAGGNADASTSAAASGDGDANIIQSASVEGAGLATASVMTSRGAAEAGMRTETDATSARLGFNGTAPIAKPTGVAVTAEGIHAALVSLGLIAA